MTEQQPSLSSEEIERYARHIILPEIGGIGQQKLKASRVLVVGAGGLGSPIIQYLAAAGIGTIGIIDNDKVSLSNLQRQVIHDVASIGTPKVNSAAGSVLRLNPHVRVETYEQRLNEDIAHQIVLNYDIIIDATDNYETRLMLADAAEIAERPFISAAIGRFDGSITVFAPFNTSEQGELTPRFRDLYPKAPPRGAIPSCAEAGVLGVLPAVIGSLQAMEAIKLITGIGKPLIGRLLLYDALSARFDTIIYKRKLSNSAAK